MKQFYCNRPVQHQWRAFRVFALLLVMALGANADATAQTVTEAKADTTQHVVDASVSAAAQPASDAKASPATGPRIQALYETGNPAQDSVFALDSYLTMEVSGLVPYLRRQEALLRAQGLAPEQAHAKAQDLILYINDAPLVGMGPESVHMLPATGADTLTKLIFHLIRSPSTYQYWSVVYASPWQFMHPGKIGLGYADRVITNIYPSDGKPCA